MTDTVNNPDTLLSDSKSMAFYVLRDEQLVICNSRKDLPYWKNRSTYLSEGRYSPEHRKVIFWPDPVNPARAMKLLEDGNHIEADYSYTVAIATTRASKSKTKSAVDKLRGVRKRSVEVLLERGMKQQVREVDSKEGKA